MAARKTGSLKSSRQLAQGSALQLHQSAPFANHLLKPESLAAQSSSHSTLSDEEYFARLTSSPEFQDLTRRRPALDIAEDVISLRRHLGLTQVQLAEALHTHQPAVARVESGTANPTIQTLTEYALALHAYLRVRLVLIQEYVPEGHVQEWNQGLFGRTVLNAASGQQLQISYRVTHYVRHHAHDESLEIGPTAPIDVGSPASVRMIGSSA